MINKRENSNNPISIEQQFKQYFSSIDALRNDQVLKFKRSLNNKNVSYAEKRLLLARLEIHQQNWIGAIAILDTFKSRYHPFVSGERYFLTSFSFQMLKNDQEAIKALETSLNFYLEIEHGRGVFNCYYNLGTVYEAQSKLELAKQAYELAHQWSYGLEEELHTQKSAAYLACHLGDYQEAYELLQEIVPKCENLNIKEKSSILKSSYGIAFLCGKYELAQKLNEKALVHRSSPYYYEALCDKFLLLFSKDQMVPKKFPRSLKERPEGLRWMIVVNLSRGYFPRAKEDWEKLRRESPSIYGSFLQFNSPFKEVGIFGRCLEHFSLPDQKILERKNEFFDLPEEPVERLLEILRRAKGPVCREDLIELIWEHEYDPKYHSKFYKLIKKAEKVMAIRKSKSGYWIG